MDIKEPCVISATEASRSFSELLHRVCYGGESFVIKKGNRLMARITPVTQEPEHKQKTSLAVPQAAAPETEETIQEIAEDGAVEYFKTMIAQLSVNQGEDA